MAVAHYILSDSSGNKVCEVWIYSVRVRDGWLFLDFLYRQYSGTGNPCIVLCQGIPSPSGNGWEKLYTIATITPSRSGTGYSETREGMWYRLPEPIGSAPYLVLIYSEDCSGRGKVIGYIDMRRYVAPSTESGFPISSSLVLTLIGIIAVVGLTYLLTRKK